MNILVNSLIKIGGIKYRVLWIGPEIVVIISLEYNKMPILMAKKEVDNLTKELKIEVIEDTEILRINEDTKHEKRRDEIWGKMKGLLLDEPRIFDKKYRREKVLESMGEIQFSEQHIHTLMKKYWKGGKSIDALMPAYKNCGAHGKERTSGGLKRGRPNLLNEKGVNITPEWKKIFTKAIDKYFYSKTKASLVMTYNLMRNDCLDENPLVVIPTLSQFRYWFLKIKSVKKEISSRYSSKKYLKDYRPLLGSKDDTILMPGTYEIDNHLADFHLVSDFNRDWVIGRPTLTVLVDRFSRLIAGVYVGLDSSYSNSMMGLYNATLDKVEFCKRYEIEIHEDCWPCVGLPQKLIADRGEIEGDSIDNLINTLGVEIEIQPSYRADMKGIVEGFFFVLNSNIKSLLPGEIDMDTRERGSRDYRLSARLTLHEYTQIVIEAILYYNKGFLQNYRRTSMMIKDNLVPTPLNLWKWGQENYGTSIRYADNKVKLALMPKSEGTVTRSGIKFKKMFYVSRGMVKKGVFEKGGVIDSRVSIWYDPRNLQQIYVKNPEGEVEVCKLLSKSKNFSDRNIEECDQLIDKENEMKREFQLENQNERVKLINKIKKVVEKSNEESSMNLSNRERISNIKENRRAEKAYHQSLGFLEIIEEEDDEYSK